MQNLKTKKVFKVRKCPAICGNKTNGANIAYGMSLVTIIFQFCVKKKQPNKKTRICGKWLMRKWLMRKWLMIS